MEAPPKCFMAAHGRVGNAASKAQSGKSAEPLLVVLSLFFSYELLMRKDGAYYRLGFCDHGVDRDTHQRAYMGGGNAADGGPGMASG